MSKALCFLVVLSLILPSPGWSHDALPLEVIHQNPEAPYDSSSAPQENTTIIHRVEAHEFLAGDSPLSPSVPSSTPLVSILSQALPPETNFVSKTSTGLYEITLDNYFEALRQAVMPASATAGFTSSELVNVEFAALKSRALEGLASLYDFLIFLPTESARQKLPKLNLAAGFGVQGFGGADKDDIQGLGSLSSDAALLQRLNNTFGPFFEENFSGFLSEADSRGTHQGTAWVDFDAIVDADIDSRKYDQFVTLQEVAHRWGMNLSASPSNDNPLKILGREFAHWSVFFDAGTSPMDGLDWRDNGNGTFTLLSIFGIPMSSLIAGDLQTQSNAFNDFDLYAMGLLSSAQAASSFVIDNPKTLSGASLTEENFFNLFSDFSFLLNPTIQGSRHTIGIPDITAINGTRSPSSATSQKNFSAAVVVVKSGTESASQLDAHRSKVNSLTSSLSSLWSSATRGLSTLTLGPLAGAFNFFRDQAASLFDETVSSIQAENTANLTTQVTRAKNNQTAITPLENQITDIENLLQPLLVRAQNDAAFRQALTPVTDRVTALKTSVKNFKAQLQQGLDEEAALPAEISSRKQTILSLLNASAVSGILPLGFGATADRSLEEVEDLYLDLTQDLKTTSTTFENQKNSIKQELDQLQNKTGPDTSAPTGTFQINGGASQTSSGLLNFNMNFTDSQLGPALMRYSTNFGNSWSEFQTYSQNFPVTAWFSQGSDIRFQVQVCDFFGNCSAAENHILYQYSDSIVPTGSFQINGGAATTATGNLHLNLNFSDTGSQPGFVRYSTNLGQSWSAFHDYVPAWDIEEHYSQGTQFRLLMQVCDYAWNCSTAENTILYQYNDSTPPSGGFQINGGAATTSTGQLRLNLNFSDDNSKLGFMRYSKDRGKTWSAFQNYASTLDLEEWHSQGTDFKIMVQACDYAWNCTAETRSIRYQYEDSTPPSGTVLIHGGPVSSVTLNIQFQENETRLGFMRYSTTFGSAWSSFIPYASSFDIPLTNQVLLQVCDVAWNCSTAWDDIIFTS